jgi:hypothetical protein
MPAICPRSYKECQRLYHEELSRLASLAFHQYCRNPCQRLYLYGTTRTGNTGMGFYDLTIACDESPLEVVITEHIPVNLTQDGMRGWLQQRLGRTPLWPFCD